ncbi:hypothetical protein BaRGS_00034006 [Batillaria attramentaria]|uniref:Uncharacterized protein n=1 Tax=Batillaria attramentaria TaxID=370345 RepID=A0ABD0JIJ9_9CAEN
MDCPADHCCRDPFSKDVLVADIFGFVHDLGGARRGQCVAGQAKPGEQCDFRCGCPAGYECYRPLTGVCCPPSTCITVDEANANREKWRCARYLPVRRRRESPLINKLLTTMMPNCPALPPAIMPQIGSLESPLQPPKGSMP